MSARPTRYSAGIVTICVLTSAAALAWAYLLCLHGGYWRTGPRLPPVPAATVSANTVSANTVPLPAITAVIPARNEADMLPACLPSLLGQHYDGRFAVVLVDDDSSDGTAKVATVIGTEAGWQVTAVAADGSVTPPGDRELAIITARSCPPGWAGKVWAMAEGVRAARALTPATCYAPTPTSPTAPAH